MATLDDISDVRVQSVSSLRDVLTASAGITDATAAVLRTERYPTGVANPERALGVLPDGWRGADAPTTGFVYAKAAGGQGAGNVGDQYNSRELTIPCVESLLDTGSPKQIDVLGDQLFATGNVVVEFRREVPADNRYLIAARYISGFDRTERGEHLESQFNLRFRSDWPWLVGHNTASVAAPYTFTPTGFRDVAWGIYWSVAPASPLVVTVAGGGSTASASYEWSPSSPPASGMISVSFPFGEATGNPTLTATSNFLPTYLTPGTAYTITAAGCRLWWLRNYRSI